MDFSEVRSYKIKEFSVERKTYSAIEQYRGYVYLQNGSRYNVDGISFIDVYTKLMKFAKLAKENL